MKITAYEVADFKRIRNARIEPGETALIVIAGQNGQGKSSLLDGLTAAFGGKRQTDPRPVREGADHAELTIELDGGALLIRRRIAADGRQQLEIYDETGKRRAPQRILDDLVGARFLDPLAFLRLSPREQREALIGCVRWPEGFAYGRWQAEYDAAYEERRALRRAAKELAAVAKEASERRPAAVPEAPDVAGLIGRLRDLQDQKAEREQARRAVRDARAIAEKLRDQVERQREVLARAQARLAELEQGLAAHAEEVERAVAAVPGDDDAEIDAELRQLDMDLLTADQRREEHRAAAERVEAAERAAAASLKAAGAATSADMRVAGLCERYDAAWAQAEVPVAGVEWDADQVLLGGVPFQQAAGAEQLRAALAIAMSQSPHIRDIWVKDGSLLDAQSLELVRQIAEERSYRVWLERVGEGDAGAIVVRAGELVADEAAAEVA